MRNKLHLITLGAIIGLSALSFWFIGIKPGPRGKSSDETIERRPQTSMKLESNSRAIGDSDDDSKLLPMDISRLTKALKNGDLDQASVMLRGIKKGEIEGVWNAFIVTDALQSIPYSIHVLLAAAVRGSNFGETKLVLDLITNDLGPGNNRSMLVEGVFAGSSIPFPDLANLASNLKEENDRESGLKGLINSVIYFNNLDVIKSLNLTNLDPDVVESIASGVARRPAYAFRERGVNPAIEIAEAMDFAKSFSDHSGATRAFLQSLVNSGHGPELWSILEDRGFFSEERNKEYDDILIPKFNNSPIDAVGLLTKMHGISAATSADILNRAANSDISIVTDWYQKNEANLSPETLSGAAAMFAENGAKLGEFNTARDWLKEIGDPDLRKDAGLKVWWAEKAAVDRDSKNDPELLISNLISDNPTHKEYWIKTAYSEWQKSNPSAADSWYEDNRAELTPQQNQHVALAFADEAIRNGDLQKARQWAQEVVDPKLSLELQLQITDSESKDQ